MCHHVFRSKCIWDPFPASSVARPLTFEIMSSIAGNRIAISARDLESFQTSAFQHMFSCSPFRPTPPLFPLRRPDTPPEAILSQALLHLFRTSGPGTAVYPETPSKQAHAGPGLHSSPARTQLVGGTLFWTHGITFWRRRSAPADTTGRPALLTKAFPRYLAARPAWVADVRNTRFPDASASRAPCHPCNQACVSRLFDTRAQLAPRS